MSESNLVSQWAAKRREEDNVFTPTSPLAPAASDVPVTGLVPVPAAPFKSPVVTWAENKREAAAERARSTMTFARDNPSSDAAEAVRLADEALELLGRAVDPASLNTTEELMTAQILDAERMRTLRQSPRTSAWIAASPINAQLAEAELQDLGYLEGILHKFGSATHKLTLGVGNFSAVTRDTEALQGLIDARDDQDLSFLEIFESEINRPQLLPSGNIVPAIDAIGRYLNANTQQVYEAMFGSDGLDASISGAQETLDKTLSSSAALGQQRAETFGNARSVAMVNEMVAPLSGKPWGEMLTGFAEVAKAEPTATLGWLVATAAEMGPVLAISTALTFTTKKPVFGAMLSGAGSATLGTVSVFDELVQAGGYDLSLAEDRARLTKDPALLSRLSDRAFTYGMVIGMIDGASGGIAGKALAKSAAGNMVLQSLTQAAMGASGEALAMFASDQALNAFDILVEGLAEFAFAPLEVMGVGGRAFNGMLKLNEQRQLFNAIAGVADASGMKVKAPAKFREAVAAMTADGPVETMYIDAGKMEELFQSAGIDPLKFVDSVEGMTREQYQQAVKNGGLVEIPTASFATDIVGTDFDSMLREHLQMTVDGMSAFDAKELQKTLTAATADATNIVNEIESGQRQLEQVAEDARQELVSELRRAGRTSAVAEREALQAVAFASTTAQRLGMEMEDFLKMYPLAQVSGVQQGAGSFQRVAVSELPDLMKNGDSIDAEVVRAAAAEAGLDEDATADEIAEALREFGAAVDDDVILNQSIELRKGNETLEAFGVPAGKVVKTRRLAEALNERTQKLFGKIEPTDRSPEASNRIANDIAAEVEFEVNEVPEDQSAVGWYTEKFQRAIDTLGQAYPELVDDKAFKNSNLAGVARLENSKNARKFFTALLAITSDGQKVVSNFRFASRVYAEFRVAGVLNEDGYSAGDRATSVATNLEHLNRLMDEYGPAKMHTFLLEEFTVSELNKEMKALGLKPMARMPAKAMMPRAAVVLGPKLGSFYANLMGAHGYLTMDRWFSRSFHRYRGTLLPKVSGLVGDETGAKGKKIGLARFKEMVKQADISDADATALVVIHADAYAAKNFKDGTAVEKAANTLYKAMFTDVKDDPFNTGDRGFMIATVERAQKELKSRGMDMTIADIQAVLWYYEKRLYGTLGVRKSDDISYEEAAQRAVADELAADLDQSGRPVVELYQRAGPTEPEGSGGKAGKADLEDFTGELNPEAFKKSGWAVITATQEFDGESPTSPANIAANDELRAWLERTDTPFIEVDGVYQGVDQGTNFLIIADKHTHRMIGRLYNQESILTNEGLVYMDYRPNTPVDLDNTLIGDEAKEKDFYSVMPDGTAFTMDLQFGEETESALPLNADGKVELYHWSNKARKVIDPSKAGTSDMRGEERRRSGPAKSYYGISPRDNSSDVGTGYVVEAGLGPVRHIVALDPDQLYSWFDDPQSLRATIDPTLPTLQQSGAYEQAIKDAGFKGYFVTDDGSGRAPHGDSAAVFNALVPDTTYDPRTATIAEQIAEEGLSVADMVARGMSAADIELHPAVIEATAEMARRKVTSDAKGFATDEYWDNRIYAFGDEEVTGTDEAVSRLVDSAETLAWDEDNLTPQAVRRERRAILLLGAPASGKSTIANPLARSTRSAIIDADEAKKVIPEYDSGIGAGAVHTESSAVAAKVLDEVLLKGDNIVWPKVGATPESIRKWVDRLQTYGYSVEIVGVDVTPDNAWRRMYGRFAATGRIIPPSVMRTGVEGPAQTYETLKEEGVADGFAKIDNNQAFGEVPEVLEDVSGIFAGFRRQVGRSGDGRDVRGDGSTGAEADGVELNQSAAFKTWFGDSKVVDESGDPLVVYHGTQGVFTAFDADKFGSRDGGFYGLGVYFATDMMTAEDFGLDDVTGEEGTTIAAYVSLQNPFTFDMSTAEGRADTEARLKELGVRDVKLTNPWDNLVGDQPRKFTALAKKAGYDGVLVVQEESDGEASLGEVVAFEATQIKSAESNRGTFSRTDPNILNQGKRGSIILPRKAGEGTRPVVNLFKDADLSTFLHESGHYFLYVLQDIAARGDGPAQMKQDWESLRNWWRTNAEAVAKDGDVTTDQVLQLLKTGTTGDAEVDAKINVGLQEQFARAYETYLLEGKAPSTALRAAFEAFSAWLLSIYRTARNLDVDVTNEVRQVFDRMLATDEEIASVAKENNMDALVGTAEEMGVTPEEYAALQLLGQQAKDEAHQKMMLEIMAPIRAARTKEYRAAKAEVREKVEREVNARPVNRAREWMGNRRWLGEDAPQSLPEGLRMEKTGLIQDYGDETVAALPRGKYALWSTDGTGASADEVAGWFGFNSGDEMIQALITSPNPKKEIDARTDAQMRRTHGDIMTDGKMEAEAVDALHGDKRGQLLAAELKALHKNASKGTPVTTRSQARHIARKTIRAMPTRKAVRSNQYLAAERRAAEKSARLLAEGDINGAHEAKRHQLLNYSLYMESREADALLGRAEREVAKLKKKSVRENLAGEYIGAIDEILDKYDFRKLSRRSEQRRAALNAYVEMMTDAGRANEMAIPDFVLDEAHRQPYKTLRVMELEGVYESLKNIEHTARMKKKLRDAQSQRDLDEVAEGFVAEFDANVADRASNRVQTRAERARATTREWMNLLLNADTILRKIGGFERGAAYEAIKAPIDAASDVSTTMRAEAADSLKALYDGYSRKTQNKMAVKKHYAELGGAFSQWDLISAALNMGNEDNLARLMDKDNGRGFSSAQVDFIKEQLDARDWKFVRDTWAYVDSFWSLIAERERRATGLVPTKVVAADVQTPQGIIRGGYYPIKYDGTLQGRVSNEDIAATMQNMQAGKFAKAQTRRGHLKERGNGSGGRALQLGMEVLNMHIGQVIHDLAFSEAVNNSWRVLQDPRVRAAFERKSLLGDHTALELWLQDTATGQIAAGGAPSKFALRMKSGFTVSKLAFNLSTVAVQLTGVAQSMVVIGKKNFAIGMSQYTSNPLRAAREVAEVSAFMAERETTFHRDINDILGEIQKGPTASAYDRWIQNVAKVGFSLMQTVQFYGVDVPTWLGAYNQGVKDKGMTDAQAKLHADRMVARAQASGQFADRSAFERGTLSHDTRQNGFVRLFTTLGSYMFAKGNIAYEVAGRTRRDVTGFNAQSFAAAFSGAFDMTLLFTLEAILYNLIKGTLPNMGDDEDESWTKFLAEETALSMISTVPFGRDVGSALSGFDAGAYSSIIETMVKPVVQLGQFEIDKALVKAVIGATGTATGLPSTAINRVVDAAWRKSEGDDVSPVEVLMGAKY